MLRRFLIAATILALVPAFYTQTPLRAAAADIQAIRQEHCQRMENALKDMQREDRGMADEIASLQAQIDLAQSGSAGNIDKMVGQTLAEVRSLRKTVAFDETIHTNLVQNYSIWRSVWENGSTKQEALAQEPRIEAQIVRRAALWHRDAAALKDAEKRLDYWTERETEAASGGIVTSKSPPYALNDLKYRQKELLQDRVQVQRDIRSLQSTYAAVNCASLAGSKPVTRSSAQATWSGTWSRAELAGQLILTQTGSSVSGRYTWNDGSGRVSGSVSGATLTGGFNETHYKGSFVLTLSGRRFSGSYTGTNKDTHGEISGPFNGTCVSGDCLHNP